MKLFRTYKYFLGVLLLALYTFVATPVQFWHHHNNGHAVRQTQLTANSNFDILTTNNGALDADCSICSHKYASYSTVDLIAFEPLVQALPATRGGYQLLCIKAPFFVLGNKGPPVI